MWEENAEAVRMFVRLSTQWRVSQGGVIGFDYSVLFKLIELYDIAPAKDIFEDIQIMEMAALAVLNKKAD